ncbi:ribosomal protein S6 [Abortiporus biennis]|nr:ribosomal protein S6 [Abortiporus biennis]
MPFYQLVCISAHYNEITHIKNLVRQTASHVLKSGGVVRKLDSWGTRSLPQRIKAGNTVHNFADYWAMDFDTSPATVNSLRNLLRVDPRVLRSTVIKQGEKVEDIVSTRSKTRV